VAFTFSQDVLKAFQASSAWAGYKPRPAFTWQEIERRPVGPVQDHLDEDGMASKGDDEFWDDDDYDYLFSHTVENPGECTPSI
jgi:hypothetical protein